MPKIPAEAILSEWLGKPEVQQRSFVQTSVSLSPERSFVINPHAQQRQCLIGGMWGAKFLKLIIGRISTGDDFDQADEEPCG